MRPVRFGIVLDRFPALRADMPDSCQSIPLLGYTPRARHRAMKILRAVAHGGPNGMS
jgi:hypothetical protein